MYSEIKQFWDKKYQLTQIKNEMKGYYMKLANNPSAKDNEIDNDIERTFQDEPAFQKGGSQFIKLKRILRATSLHLPNIGYVQGFNQIVACLLKILRDEELVFWMFASILTSQNLSNFYIDKLPGLMLL